jgi:predicted anti-sigma-YlaC factor YlaD
MSTVHLSTMDVEAYVENELDEPARARMDRHLNKCPTCRGRVASEARLATALREMREPAAPRDLAARVTAAVELRVGHRHARQQRLPYLIAATCFSLLLTAWLGLNMLVAFQDSGALDFLGLITNQPEGFSAYTTDAFLALLEALPIPEITLTCLAVLVVIVLAQQWADAAVPGGSSFRQERS